MSPLGDKELITHVGLSSSPAAVSCNQVDKIRIVVKRRACIIYHHLEYR